MTRTPSCRPSSFPRQGFTLTELAIVLLCVSFITGAIWIANGMVWGNYRVYRALQQANTIIQNIRDQYSACQSLTAPTAVCATPGTAGNVTKAMDALNLFPVEMRRDPSLAPGTSPIDDVFNDDPVLFLTGSFLVNVLPCASLGAVNPNMECFRLNFAGMNQDACIKMLTQAPINTDEGIVQIGVNAGVANNVIMDNAAIINGVGSGGNILPVKVSVAKSWCANAGAGGTNWVYWDLRLHP